MIFTDYNGRGRFYLGDCLEIMKEIPNGVIDMVLADLPYGTTDCKWDTILSFELLWQEYKRLVKPRTPIVLTANQPFTSALIMSNVSNFRTTWIWNKKLAGGFANAKYHPLKITEDIVIFSYKTPMNYFPVMRKGLMRPKSGYKHKINEIQSGIKPNETKTNDDYYPINIIEFRTERGTNIHPTQKPVALFEYLIKTYTNENDLILDNTAGSGTTAIAAINTNRKWVCIEKDETYYNAAIQRINERCSSTI